MEQYFSGGSFASSEAYQKRSPQQSDQERDDHIAWPVCPQSYSGYKAENKKNTACCHYDGAEKTGIFYRGQNRQET
jgi:hypothetical protein